MTPNTLHQYRPLANFHADWHFIYITGRSDEIKEELQSYYKLNKEDMEEITKEWLAEFLVPIEDGELSDLTSSEVHWSPGSNMMDRRKRRKRRKSKE
jgi:hypothetical protein